MAEGGSGSETGSEVVIPTTSSPAPEPESSPADTVLKVLAAVGTGIGIIGFVTLFGGALIWVRAERAELPATEAVSVVPHNVLVTTGATFLLPAVLIAAGVVAVVFLAHLIFQLVETCKLRPKRRKAKRQRQRSAKTARTAVTEQQAWKVAEAALQRRQSELDAAHKRHASATEIAPLETAVREKRVEAERLLEVSERSVSDAATAKASADELIEEAEEKLERGPVQWWIELALAGVLLIVAVPWINGSIRHLAFNWELGLLVLAAIAGMAITLLVYWRTEKFVWFGVVAFLAVGIYLATATYFSTHRNPKLQPVAALRSGHEPVVGSYIAATSESLYVGTFRERETPPRLIVVPRAQITEFVIGPPLETSQARHRAITMALNECAQEVEQKPATEQKPAAGEEQTSVTEQASEPQAEEEPKYGPACTEEQIEALKAR